MTSFCFSMLIPQEVNTSMADLGPFLLIFFLVWFVFCVLPIVAGQWKMFTKAGKPGWAAIVPIYNIIVWVEVAGRPIWWFIMLLIPFVNFVISIILVIDITNKFGRGGGTIVGLIFLPIVFFPILGFGSAQYNAEA